MRLSASERDRRHSSYCGSTRPVKQKQNVKEVKVTVKEIEVARKALRWFRWGLLGRRSMMTLKPTIQLHSERKYHADAAAAAAGGGSAAAAAAKARAKAKA